jgi:predicted dehydrogenase
MLRIGLVDLDTSHPQAFTKILRMIPGVVVAALWDGHDVWPAGYDRRFAVENGIPVVCTALEEMPDHVDAAMIHGTNWDTHIDRALVFMKAKIPVLIDKPVVGSVRDCDRLLNMREKYGTTVFGGSSLRYAGEVTDLCRAVRSREDLVSMVASGPGDFFSYGIHTTEMLQGFAGTGIRSVKAVTRAGAPVLSVEYKDGLSGTLYLQRAFHEWSLCAYTSSGLRTAIVNTEKLYEPFLRNFLTMLGGGNVGFDLAAPLEAVRVHIAANIALEKGSEVSLDDIPPDAGFDGRAFAAEYAAMKRRQASGTPQT